MTGGAPLVPPPAEAAVLVPERGPPLETPTDPQAATLSAMSSPSKPKRRRRKLFGSVKTIPCNPGLPFEDCKSRQDSQSETVNGARSERGAGNPAISDKHCCWPETGGFASPPCGGFALASGASRTSHVQTRNMSLRTDMGRRVGFHSAAHRTNRCCVLRTLMLEALAREPALRVASGAASNFQCRPGERRARRADYVKRAQARW
jgi:hypothetical protein